MLIRQLVGLSRYIYSGISRLCVRWQNTHTNDRPSCPATISGQPGSAASSVIGAIVCVELANRFGQQKRVGSEERVRAQSDFGVLWRMMPERGQVCYFDSSMLGLSGGRYHPSSTFQVWIQGSATVRAGVQADPDVGKWRWLWPDQLQCRGWSTTNVGRGRGAATGAERIPVCRYFINVSNALMLKVRVEQAALG